MTQQDHRRSGYWHGATTVLISRRGVVNSSALALLSIVSGPVLGQERKEAQAKSREERMEEFRAYGEQMRNAGPEERLRIMEERRVQDQRRAIEDFKERLAISDKDWPVVRPRIEKVYTLVRPLPQMGTGNGRPKTEVERRSDELWNLLRHEPAAVDKVKASLTALRAAKEKAAQDLIAAKQDLRQLMTVRQEAELVLSGLLD